MSLGNVPLVPEDSSVVDEDGYPTKRIHCALDNCVAVGDVGRVDDRVSASCVGLRSVLSVTIECTYTDLS